MLTSVLLKSSLGNRALHLPQTLSRQPLYGRPLFSEPSLFRFVEHLWIFDFSSRSLTVALNRNHQDSIDSEVCSSQSTLDVP